MPEETIPAEPTRPAAEPAPTLTQPATTAAPAEPAAPPTEHAAAAPPPATATAPAGPPPGGQPPFGPWRRPGYPVWAGRNRTWLPVLIMGIVGLIIGCMVGGGIGFVAGHFGGHERGGNNWRHPGFDDRRGVPPVQRMPRGPNGAPIPPPARPAPTASPS